MNDNAWSRGITTNAPAQMMHENTLRLAYAWPTLGSCFEITI